MAIREYVDPSGRTWDVWAVYPTIAISGQVPVDSRAANGWLAFQCGNLRRRFYGPPDGWETMSDKQIGALWESAVEVAPPRAARG
jgi:hypothetical protein